MTTVVRNKGKEVIEFRKQNITFVFLRSILEHIKDLSLSVRGRGPDMVLPSKEKVVRRLERTLVSLFRTIT